MLSKHDQSAKRRAAQLELPSGKRCDLKSLISKFKSLIILEKFLRLKNQTLNQRLWFPRREQFNQTFCATYVKSFIVSLTSSKRGPPNERISSPGAISSSGARPSSAQKRASERFARGVLPARLRGLGIGERQRCLLKQPNPTHPKIWANYLTSQI